jgi:hypothetical protein
MGFRNMEGAKKIKKDKACGEKFSLERERACYYGEFNGAPLNYFNGLTAVAGWLGENDELDEFFEEDSEDEPEQRTGCEIHLRQQCTL